MLSKEQQAIVYSTQPSLIVQALAGTGKTTTLACTAVHTLRLQPSAKILVLACSKAGVLAFKHRLQMLLRQSPSHMHVTTLERWSARWLREQDPSVHFETEFENLRQHAEQALAYLHEQQQWHPEQYAQLPSRVDMEALQDFQRTAKKTLLLQQMQEHGWSLAEFCAQHDLDLGLAQLFLACERLRVDACGDTRFYAEGDCTYTLACRIREGDTLTVPDYDLVLFDEMHDLDLASLTVLRHLLEQSSARFVGAGDFNQHIEAQAWSIFEDKFQQLADFLPQPTTSLPLTQSRRFGPAVAQAVNAWMDVGMQGMANRRSTVTELQYQDDAQCLAHVLQAQASIVQKQANDPIPLTVLLRHPHDALALEWAIAQAGKTVSFHGLAPFYLSREIALLLGLLYAHGMQDPQWKSTHCILHEDILASFIEGALYYGQGQLAASADHQDRSTMAAQMHQHPQGIWRFLIDSSHLQGGQRNLAAFGNFLSLPLHLQADAHALLEQADVWGLFAGVPLTDAYRHDLRERVQAFIAMVQGLSVSQVLQRIATMAQRYADAVRKQRAFDFQLLNIETAKGMEFEYVALPFLEPGRFPAPAAHAVAFLERNRLYVAMTRAKQRLWLMEHAHRRIRPFAA